MVLIPLQVLHRFASIFHFKSLALYTHLMCELDNQSDLFWVENLQHLPYIQTSLLNTVHGRSQEYELSEENQPLCSFTCRMRLASLWTCTCCGNAQGATTSLVPRDPISILMNVAEIEKFTGRCNDQFKMYAVTKYANQIILLSHWLKLMVFFN